ncbi:Rv1733c family protein [Streptomyces sp. URMC 126]|uniref:Rv1733c family protein n=1 Tax=Streptomyces sp. URMC 126 TaxID=3423401 RepID=UPI003F1AAE99
MNATSRMWSRARRSAWRWRRSPLRRPTDVLEHWVGVAAVLLMLVVGPLAGLSAGTSAHAVLRQTVREQRSHRHLVTAVALRPEPVRGAAGDREGVPGRDGYHRIPARWPGPDGGWRTGLVPLRGAEAPGRRFPLWTDDQGRLAGRPLDGTTASVHAALAGAGAALGAAGAVHGLRRLVMWRVIRRRYERWDRAWERAGHTWGRADAGS